MNECNQDTNLQDNDMDVSESKHRKLRGKDLRKINEQMEFYFSPANLRRDRFLGNIVRSSTDGYVYLEMFLTFYEIQKFTNDVNDIIKAVKKSSQLELSSDNKKIRSKNQEESKVSNYDDCTIYVERLPQNADHHFVRNIFNRFGKITYVSLPKFKNGEKIKGFAFVEFENPDCVHKACQAYKFSNDSETESEDAAVEDAKKKLNPKKKSTEFCLTKTKESFNIKLSRKQKKSEIEKQLNKNSRALSVSKENVSITTTENEEVSNQNKGSNKKRRKRKRYSSESEVIEKKMKKLLTESESNDSSDDRKIDPSRKRTISESNMTAGNENKGDDEREKLSAKKQKLEGDHVASVKEKNEEVDVKKEMEFTEDKTEKQKKRKRKKKDIEKPKFKVLSKAEWKSYKNKYLMMQKKAMSSVKKLLLLTKKQQAECEAMLSKSEERINELIPESEKDTAKPSNSKMDFQSGVIVKLSLKESVDVPSNLIKNIKSKVDVAFIDVCDKDQAFVRFSDPSLVKDALETDVLKLFGVAELVTGDDEIAYWEKLHRDREAHINRPRTNKRGRDKIIAKANALKKQNTHVHFDDSF